MFGSLNMSKKRRSKGTSNTRVEESMKRATQRPRKSPAIGQKRSIVACFSAAAVVGLRASFFLLVDIREERSGQGNGVK